MPNDDPSGHGGGKPSAADVALAALSAVLGDHLHRSGNPLAIETGFHDGGRRLDPSSIAGATGRLSIWVHGLGVTEAVFAYPDDPSRSYGSLARAHGYTPLHFRYNTGRHVAENGAELAAAIEALRWPVPVTEILLAGYSMGGLVVRAACQAAADAGMAWLPLVRRAFYLGVPHEGAPLERLGQVVAWTLRTVPNAVTRMIADVVDLRSSGIRDLDRGRVVAGEPGDPRLPLRPAPEVSPLRPGIDHHLVVGTLGARERRLVDLLFGDGVVPVSSARFAVQKPARVTVVRGVGHLGLAHSDAVWAVIDAALQEAT